MFSLLLLAAVATFFATTGFTTADTTTTAYIHRSTGPPTYTSWRRTTFIPRSTRDPRTTRLDGSSARTARTTGPVIRAPPEPCDSTAPKDCQDVLLQDSAAGDGIYRVCPGGPRSKPIEVQCNMQGGGWTMLLNRFDGSVDFNQNWYEMKRLVGDLSGEFWLGLEDIHLFTTSGRYSVMVEIHEGLSNWTEIYNTFTLAGEAQLYRPRVGGYNDRSTNKYHSLRTHNTIPFSTRDQRSTGHRHNTICAEFRGGPGWFNDYCTGYVHLFGLHMGQTTDTVKMMRWYVPNRVVYPTKLSMKIKRRP